MLYAQAVALLGLAQVALSSTVTLSSTRSSATTCLTLLGTKSVKKVSTSYAKEISQTWEYVRGTSTTTPIVTITPAIVTKVLSSTSTIGQTVTASNITGEHVSK